MSRINTNVPSIIAQRILSVQSDGLNKTLNRLSTGLRINSGRDDPAGLIASEVMRTEQRAIQAAQSNIARAINVVSVSESGLVEIGRLLKDLEDLVDRSSNEAGISDQERDANQQEIDLILDSINRIANSTELQGRRLLRGDLDYTTSNVSATQISDLQINSARVPEGSHRQVAVDVNIAASLASVKYIGGTITGSSRTIEIIGNLGTERLTFGSGTTLSAIVAAVNASKAMTGVSATLASAGGAVQFNSTEYGSAQFTKVRLLSGSSFTMESGKSEDQGADAVVQVNGVTVQATGLQVSVRSSTLDADISLKAAFGTVVGGQSQFQITGGGADFSIAPQLDLNGRASLGIGAVTTGALGDGNVGRLYTLATGETNALNAGNYFTAQRIVRAAVERVAGLQARLGSFQKNTLETVRNSLQVQYENVAAAESMVRDADYANETSQLTRSQILVQSATMVLQQANAAPQNVLRLLG